MSFILGKCKFLFALTIIGLYFVFALPLFPLIIFAPNLYKSYAAKLVSLVSRIILITMKVRVKYNGDIDNSENYFIVANHLTYIDILIISQKFPTLFVTSMEMKKTPILGQITDLAGCLYVDRRNRKNIHEEVKDITNALSDGFHVTVFPEATSTNGEGVIKFKRSLYEAAVDAKVSVLPITLNYQSINDEGVSLNNRDYLFWYDDTSFATHLYRLCHQSNIVVNVMVHNKVSCHEDGAFLRDRSYEIIKDSYLPIQGI